jgi:hypothetical protein
VFNLGIVRIYLAKHFQLLELVHPNNAPGVLAIRASFSSVTGGEADIPKGSVVEVNDFIGVIAGKRNFAGAGEIEIILR